MMFRALFDRLNVLARKADVDNIYTQLAALMEIRTVVGTSVPLGPFRGWAMSPDALLHVVRDVTARQAPRVIEFGAGESTIAIAAALKAGGSGSLVSIEHDAGIAAAIAARLARYGLRPYADIRVVPIRSCAARDALPAFSSYDLTGVDVPFAVALIDGPAVGTFGSATRLVPLEWALARLDDGAAVYLDDAKRSDEVRVVKTALSGRAGYETTEIEAEKGLLRIRRTTADR